MATGLKLFFSISLLVACVYAQGSDFYGGKRPPHNVRSGQRDEIRDSMITYEPVKYDWSFKGKIRVTKTFFGDHQTKITEVMLWDKNEYGRGAYAEIIEGGVGATYVTIRFKSQFWRGIDFVVELWGRKE